MRFKSFLALSLIIPTRNAILILTPKSPSAPPGFKILLRSSISWWRWLRSTVVRSSSRNAGVTIPATRFTSGFYLLERDSNHFIVGRLDKHRPNPHRQKLVLLSMNLDHLRRPRATIKQLDIISEMLGRVLIKRLA